MSAAFYAYQSVTVTSLTTCVAKYLMRHEATFSCSSLLKSEHPEKLRIEAKKYLFCCPHIDRGTKYIHYIHFFVFLFFVCLFVFCKNAAHFPLFDDSYSRLRFGLFFMQSSEGCCCCFLQVF